VSVAAPAAEDSSMSARDMGNLIGTGMHSPPAMDNDEPSSPTRTSIAGRAPSVSTFEAAKEASVYFWNIPRQTGEDYRRVTIQNAALNAQELEVTKKLRRAVDLREKWVYMRDTPEWKEQSEWQPSQTGKRHLELPFDPLLPELPPALSYEFAWVDGIVEIGSGGHEWEPSPSNMSYTAFVEDLEELQRVMNDPEARSFCWRRLELLRERFNMYQILNADQEQLSQKKFPHRDFYNVYKIDTHVHHSSLANQKEFLNFIKDKLAKSEDDIVIKQNNREMTLREVFQSIGLSEDELSVDTLDVHAGPTTFHRFDRFTLKYSPVGQSKLREIFLKTDNYNGGKYLADLTKRVLADQETLKYQLSEYRISIYGRRADEWDKLGRWFTQHHIFSPVARWLIQVPRLYPSYYAEGNVQSFQDMLSNIFNPLFEVTIHPERHPEVAALLQQVVGFDSVDDESLPADKEVLRGAKPPAEWTTVENPPYSYQQFYLQSNLACLNRLREARGLNTLSFRPHAGEAGPLEHLACTFLLANGINHGLKLKENPVLQYMYYITQIGIAMSPLSNAALFCEYIKNPCIEYFCRGLNVSLSTDDPLQFAYTREPLMEEYSVFASVFRCTNTSLCELARNSILQSGLEAVIKNVCLGPGWYMSGYSGNDPRLSNVPNMRLRYRHDTLMEEVQMLYAGPPPSSIRVLPTWSARQERPWKETDTVQPRNGARGEA
jgi:AMP deaminase